jgi:hypothetical protein
MARADGKCRLRLFSALLLDPSPRATGTFGVFHVKLLPYLAAWATFGSTGPLRRVNCSMRKRGACRPSFSHRSLPIDSSLPNRRWIKQSLRKQHDQSTKGRETRGSMRCTRSRPFTSCSDANPGEDGSDG